MKVKTFFARAGKGLAFFLVAVLLFSLVTLILMPKWSSTWKTTDTVTGFYQLEEDSIDTLFLGSSQVISGVSPMQLYQEQGISSYSLGTEQQPMLISYYLLKEALKTQPNLCTVALEITELFRQCSEPYYRKPIDAMPLSANKLEAIRAHITWDEQRAAELPESQRDPLPSFGDYLFPVFAYHDRWKELEKTDFTYFWEDRADPLRGFTVQAEQGAKGIAPLIDPASTKACTTPKDEALSFFQAIVQLCEENNISLILFKTPRSDWSADRYNTIQTLAGETGLPYFDFNTAQLQEEIGYDYTMDNMPSTVNHLNLSGAQKLTHWLGEYLSENSESADVRSTPAAEPLDAELAQYLTAVEDAELTLITDLPAYVEAISQRSRYSLLLAVRDSSTAATPFPEDAQAALAELGLNTQFCSSGSYLAVLENGTIPLQQSGGETLTQSLTLSDGSYATLSSGNGVCSISIDGTEVKLNNNVGLSIVVYNHDSGQVVDAVTFFMAETINKETGQTEWILNGKHSN